jgi:putative addiction module CopG family antidote
MQVPLQPNDQRFVARKLRNGEFPTAAAVVREALKRMRRDERDLAELKASLRDAADSLDRGEGKPWNADALKAWLRRQGAPPKRQRGTSQK